MSPCDTELATNLFEVCCHVKQQVVTNLLEAYCFVTQLVMRSKKKHFLLIKKKSLNESLKKLFFKLFFINIYNLKKEKDILILWSAYLLYTW